MRETITYIMDTGCKHRLRSVYKIGWAFNIDKRFDDLRAGNPRLRLVHTCADSKYDPSGTLETKLHRLFKHRLLERELFYLWPWELKRAIGFMQCDVWHI